MKKLLMLSLMMSFAVLAPSHASRASGMSDNLKGRILLQVESKGEAWYVSSVDGKRYSMGRPNDAFDLMRKLGIGITNDNLKKIKIANENLTGDDSDGDGLSDMIEDSIGTDKNNQDSDGDGYNDQVELTSGYNPNGAGKILIDNNFAKKQAGKILLQVESKGEAWYVNPVNSQRYYLGRPADAFAVMRALGLGITDDNLAKITVSGEHADGNSADFTDTTSSSSTGDNTKSETLLNSYMDKVLTINDYFALEKKNSKLDTIISEYHQNKSSDITYCQTSKCSIDASLMVTQAALDSGTHFKFLNEKIVNYIFVPYVLNSYQEVYKTSDGKYALFSMSEPLGMVKGICQLYTQGEVCSAEEVLKTLSGIKPTMTLSVYDNWDSYKRNQIDLNFSTDDTTVHSKTTDTFDVPDFNNLKCMLNATGWSSSGSSVTTGYYDKVTLDDSYVKSNGFSSFNNLYIVKIDDPTIINAKIENNTLLIKALKEGTTKIWLGDKGIPSSDYEVANNGCYLAKEVTVIKNCSASDGGCVWIGYSKDKMTTDGFTVTNW